MIRPKMTRKAKLFYYLLSFLIIAALFYKFELRRRIADSNVLTAGAIGTVVRVKSDNKVTITIGDQDIGLKTFDVYIPPEIIARCEIDPTPGSRFVGFARFMKLSDHHELREVWICNRKVWTWSVPKRIECYLLLTFRWS